jgi:hypothetical protein
VALVVATILARRCLHADFYYDEMWRIDFVRAPTFESRFFRQDTPVPIGWVHLLRLLRPLIPDSRLGYHMVTIVTFAVFVGLVTAVLDRIGVFPGSEGRGGRAAGRWGLLAFAAVVPFVLGLQLFRYFNNYTFDMAWGALVLLAAVSLDRSRWAFPLLLVLVATAPLFVLSGLFLLPAVGWFALRWARSGDSPDRAVPALIGASGVSALLAVVVYVHYYRPVARSSIAGYWANASLHSHASPNLVWISMRELSTGLLRTSTKASTVAFLPWVALTLVAMAVGWVLIRRSAPVVFGAALTGWLIAAVVSALTDWPATAVRVNLSFLAWWYVAALVAAGRAALRWSAASAVALALAFVLAVAHPIAAPPEAAFGRGLLPDLAVISQSGAPHNRVVAYLSLSYFYVDYALRHQLSSGRFSIVQEPPDRQLSASELAGVVDTLSPGDDLWCVIPYDVGPSAAATACAVDPVRDHLRLIIDRRGHRSIVRGYQRLP